MMWTGFFIALGILAVVAAVVMALTNNMQDANAVGVEGFNAESDYADNYASTTETDYPTRPPPSHTNVGMHSPVTAKSDNNDHANEHEESAANSVSASCATDYTASEPIGQNETFKFIGNEAKGHPTTLPKDCFPKDQLSPSELLPGDANSTWAQVNPMGQGSIEGKNFLEAGHHVGVNTVGQTLRNANLQLRSEPPNPQVKVSPWLQSTIEPDSNRRAMEIGGH